VHVCACMYVCMRVRVCSHCVTQLACLPLQSPHWTSFSLLSLLGMETRVSHSAPPLSYIPSLLFLPLNSTPCSSPVSGLLCPSCLDKWVLHRITHISWDLARNANCPAPPRPSVQDPWGGPCAAPSFLPWFENHRPRKFSALLLAAPPQCGILCSSQKSTHCQKRFVRGPVFSLLIYR
jgi:hypothetical protein